jgi:hypothetical protein
MTDPTLLSLNILSDGQSLSDTIQIVSVSVESAADTLSSAQIVVRDGDISSGIWPIADGLTFSPGTAITIQTGYSGDAQTIFDGVVVKLGIGIDEQNSSRLIIDCEDKTSPPPGPADPPALTLTWGANMMAFQADSGVDGVVRGRVKFQGADVTVGNRIILAGVGVRFNGPAPVSGMRHEIANGNWLTEAVFGPPEEKSGIVVTDKGIAITSHGDITLTAKGDITAKALNVTCEAEIAFTAKGTATAELSAAGQTTIKGAMVMIN